MVSSNFPCKCTQETFARSTSAASVALFVESLWKEARDDTYLIWIKFIKFKYDFLNQVFVSISDRPEACRRVPLGSAERAEVVALADLYAVVTQDVVGGGDVEKEVGHGEFEEIVHAGKGHAEAADR